MHLVGPQPVLLVFQGFVVVVGLPDPGRRLQHGPGRVERGDEPGVRGRRPDGLVPQTAPPLRYDVPDPEPDRGAADADHHRQRRQRLRPGRGVRVRRHVELRAPEPRDARAPPQGARRPRVAGAAQPANRGSGNPRRAGPDCRRAVRDCRDQPVHQAAGDDLGDDVHGGALHRVHRLPAADGAGGGEASLRASTSSRCCPPGISA